MSKTPIDRDGLELAETEVRPATETDRTSSATAVDGGRFVPGTILDARYRIVALLGRGGMGEVYRAEDMRLGETVALKFLPEALAMDGAALARFHREVKTARAIAHPNVVRVYDIGEQDGQPFLSMEYVDGEDLSVLLKRIGRLPSQKATELARQICAGLAAAHQAGVLHRDLKPANVMIDGEGRAKITDFGLADLATELEGPEAAGTPAYMAPEQLTDSLVSFASDLYALGLVLYEMFTGERPFAAGSRAELISRQQESRPTSPTTHVEGLDPLVEKAILRCLEREPTDRPGSALEVAASLPGGDPLAAALAAGETPSPEMVARAEIAGTLPRKLALPLLIFALLGILGTAWLMDQRSVLTVDGLPLRPEVLEHKARALLTEFGLPDDMPAVGLLEQGEAYMKSEIAVRRTREEWTRRAAQRPTFMEYVFRARPGGVFPIGRWRNQAGREDPPQTLTGMVTIVLDSRGRLQQALAVPAEPSLEVAGGTPDWAPWFAAADLDPDSWVAVAPKWVPSIYADTVVAWQGSYPGQPESMARIEAAAMGERVLQWRLVEAREPSSPWQRPENATLRGTLMLFAGILLVCGWQAVRNFRNGRGDRRAALRLALAAGGATLVAGACAQALLTRSPPLSLRLSAVAAATFWALSAWALYMFLEPVMRRHFPRGLVSWSRVISGRFSDPLVGRDLLAALALVGALNMILRGYSTWLMASGRSAPLIGFYAHGLNPLGGPLMVFGGLFAMIQIILPLALTFLFVMPRALIRHKGFSTGTGALLLAGFAYLFQGGNTAGVLWGVLLVVIVSRIGFVGVVAQTVFMNNIVLSPASLDPSQWWAASSWIGVGLVAGLAIWAYTVAVGGKRQDLPG